MTLLHRSKNSDCALSNYTQVIPKMKQFLVLKYILTYTQVHTVINVVLRKVLYLIAS